MFRLGAFMAWIRNGGGETMQKVRLPADEPAAPADPEVGTAAFARQHLASTVAPTSKGQAALDTADRYAANAHAHATKCAYRSDWAHFGDWCQAPSFIAMPAEPRTIGTERAL
ncbi:MAG: hypothetical protein ACRYG8_06310 [Janthinobacterium lividum]